jgi:hypothetical protein
MSWMVLDFAGGLCDAKGDCDGSRRFLGARPLANGVRIEVIDNKQQLQKVAGLQAFFA